MSTTMATVSNILKEVYEPKVRDQLQSEEITAKRLEKSSDGITNRAGGKYVRFAIRTRRNHGMGARNENEGLPNAGTQGYEDAEIKLTHQYGTIQLTGQVFELADSDFQAFASVMTQEIDGIKEGLAKDSNRQMYGTAKGVLATANAAGTTTTLLMANAQAIYLEEGMIFDFYSSADALEETSRTITLIERDAPAAGSTRVTFTPAAGGNTASGDYMVRDDNLNKEVTGFQSITAATGSLYTIDPASAPIWSGTEENPAAMRNISEGLIVNMIDRIRKRGGKTSVMFTSLGVRRAYWKLLVQGRRFNNTKDFEGGFSGLGISTDWGEIPMVTDFDATESTIYYLNEKELTFYHNADWSWMNKDGSHWQSVYSAPSGGGQVTRYDAYTATLFRYWNLGCHRRNSQGVQKKINEA